MYVRPLRLVAGVMNPDRSRQPSPKSTTDSEQLATLRRSSCIPDGNPVATPAFHVYIVPDDPRKRPRVIPVYPGDCLAAVILVDYVLHHKSTHPLVGN